MPPETDLTRMKEEYKRREAQEQAGDTRYAPNNQAHQFILRRRQEQTRLLLQKYHVLPLAGKRILEVGCGAGTVLHEICMLGARSKNVFGVDYLLDRLVQSRPALRGQRVICADGQQLPFASGSFDLVMQYTALSSLLDRGLRRRVAADMMRMVNPGGGWILWYDFWLNPTNPQTVGIRLSEIRSLFPGWRIHSQRITLAPPIGRLIVPSAPKLALFLENLNLFNSHILALLEPTVQ